MPYTPHITPTAEQKLAIYQRAKELVIEHVGKTKFICLAIYQAQKNLGYVDDSGKKLWSLNDYQRLDSSKYVNHMKINFPELAKLKPHNKQYGDAWWRMGNKEVNPARLRAIDKMIASVQAQINNL